MPNALGARLGGMADSLRVIRHAVAGSVGVSCNRMPGFMQALVHDGIESLRTATGPVSLTLRMVVPDGCPRITAIRRQ
jgi:hypothetical protein